MENLTEAQERKEQCLRDLREAMPRYQERLLQIDQRIHDYALDLVRTDIDIHNIDELLGFRKFLRLLDTYPFDYEYVKDILYDAEGEWRCTDGVWRHVRGGQKIDGIFGTRVYRQTPMQVFVYAWVYGFHHWVDTTSPVGSREMMETERAGDSAENEDANHIYDYRLLTRKFIALWPRKMAKTFTSSFILFEDLMRGARDSEDYIASNGSDQSKILFKMCLKFLHNMEGWKRYFRVSDNDLHRFIQWKPDTGRTASITALSSNPDNKDGLKATKIAADEFGAAKRSRGNAAEMEKLVGVLEGSQGPIREPLTFHSSTAGLGVETPYETMVNGVHTSLLEELEIPLDGKPHRTDYDGTGCSLLRPDEWERGDDLLLRTERVIRKVNPNVGVTIQPDYYANEWKNAEIDGDVKRKEVVTKLYNIFCTDRAVDWITGDEVRPLMINADDESDWPRKIEDCKQSDGWVVLSGMDFTNVGDDLQALTFLACRRNKETKRMQFFVQFDAWVTMEAVLKSQYKNLLLQWADEGYLQIVSGKMLSSAMVVNRIVSLRNDHGCAMVGFGYDPFKSKDAVNALKSWIVSIGLKPDQIGNVLMPVSQTYGSVNPVLEEVTALIYDPEPMIRFAYSPLVPWEFSNCRVAESADGMENKKIVKANPDSPNKVDNCQALLNAFTVYDAMMGKYIG